VTLRFNESGDGLSPLDVSGILSFLWTRLVEGRAWEAAQKVFFFTWTLRDGDTCNLWVEKSREGFEITMFPFPRSPRQLLNWKSDMVSKAMESLSPCEVASLLPWNPWGEDYGAD